MAPNRVLVSGIAQQVEQVTAALLARGTAVTPVVDLAEIPAACTAVGPDAFDAYVQLPSTFTVRGSTAIQRVHHFYAEGVLARFGALDTALGSLVTGARVVFVMGTLPPEAATIDDREARKALTRVLAHAARADAADRLVTRVLEAGAAADDIAFVALGGDLARRELMERLDHLTDADWRTELLGLAAVQT